ncbi:hypothetical protein [Curvibacter phage TJ1]|nr:hypothetical protein [Curvibacter phage TJ1]
MLLETKAAMGYTPAPNRCSKCRYFTEQDHPVLERMWLKLCTYSVLCKFEVEENGHCNKFEEKEPQP